MKSLIFVFAAASALMSAVPAQAALINFHADLMGSNEVPSNASRATGVADFTLDTVAGTFSASSLFSLTRPHSETPCRY